MADIEDITLETELSSEEASHDIAQAVGARHSVARKYVLRLRRKYPEATPGQIIAMLERHYATSITTAGAVLEAGKIAASIGISMIPGGGAAATGVKVAGQQVAKKAAGEAAKATVKQVAKNAALGTARTGLAKLIPAGEQQIQFEITALFGLAIADIHGMRLDQDRSHALILGLTNDRVSQKQIAKMTADVAAASQGDVTQEVAVPEGGRGDWSNWANRLADSMPDGTAQSLVRTIETGQLDTVPLSGKQQAAIDYGVAAVAGGVARFRFGQDVIKSSRAAFASAPEVFPAHLIAPEKDPTLDTDDEQNRALAALEDAAKSTGTVIASAAGAVGSGVSTAASKVSRPFRGVDLDGDGIPDEAQALTAVKNVGGALAGAAGSVGGRAAGLFKRRRGETEPADTTADDV